MALLSDKVREKVTQVLDKLPSSVKLVLFSQEIECPTCRETRSLVEEVAGLSDKVTHEVLNLQLDKGPADKFKVDKVPAICVVKADGADNGIRLYGIPSGYEFTTLLAAIQLVGTGDSGLKPETREKLAGLKEPVDINVFVTLTCPYCPGMASLAHRFALESDKVTAAVIDAGEFPQLANLYEVMAVPRTVVNRTLKFDGMVPEDKLLEHVLAAAETPA